MTAWNFTKKTTVREISKQFDQIAAALRRNLAAKVWIFTAEIILRIMSAPQVDLGTCQPETVIQFLGALGNYRFWLEKNSSRERWSWWFLCIIWKVVFIKSSFESFDENNWKLMVENVIWNEIIQLNGMDVWDLRNGMHLDLWGSFWSNRNRYRDYDSEQLTSRMICTNREVLCYAYLMCFLWYGFVLNFKTLPSQRQRRAVKRPKLSLRLFSYRNPFGVDLGVGGFCVRHKIGDVLHLPRLYLPRL